MRFWDFMSGIMIGSVLVIITLLAMFGISNDADFPQYEAGYKQALLDIETKSKLKWKLNKSNTVTHTFTKQETNEKGK